VTIWHVMRVNVNNFKEFLMKVNTNGLIRDTVLDFGRDGLRITSMDESKTAAVSGVLYSEGSITDSTIMQVGIHDVIRVINALKMMSGDIEVRLEGNKFVLDNGGYVAAFNITNQKYLRWPMPHERWPRIYKHEGFDVDNTFFERVKKSSTLFDSSDVVARIHEGKFTMSVEGKSGDRGVAVMDIDCDREVQAKYGPAMLRVIKSVTGVAKVMFGSNKPIVITNEDGVMHVQWMASPVLEGTV